MPVPIEAKTESVRIASGVGEAVGTPVTGGLAVGVPGVPLAGEDAVGAVVGLTPAGEPPPTVDPAPHPARTSAQKAFASKA
jgi:hypothetical protein